MNTPCDGVFFRLRKRNWFSLVLVSAVILIASCAKKPNRQELDRLEEARKAAEAAEAQLERIKKERLSLEKELSQQKNLLEQKELLLTKFMVWQLMKLCYGLFPM